MSALTRFDPFSADLDDMFKGLFVRPVRFDIEGLPHLQIKLEVKRNDDAYTVSAELPGVKKEDIHVEVDGNQVTISAEVKKESEEKKGELVLRSERYYGKLERGFTLDSDIDESKVEAKYADGVLKLVLPKKARATSKRISVK
ncbi:MAG: Hsp20 family protein [Betaproteobacteria bacterium]|nr:Hsp20 family protein [Betaproteobacteria bacterium]